MFPLNILLIDDDPECLDSLNIALSSKGYSLKGFCNPLDAIKAYKTNEFDVVITDIKMPHLDGIQVLKTILAINPEAYVIVITAFDDVENSLAAQREGAYAFFSKPLNIRVMLDELSRIEKNSDKKG